ncbi:hypothetical protein K504DRAFT_463582 [Pleomassaria siparia CBS 279.74]|uniref:Uncharacterized protein n=1 Tax=Pleomassaria siparia CBS 279.74 TaxID=1314801 RepID=A0A6G1JSD3_9PLEO|nr:hypothetical protein K504DRAFT_463582 [Pleomassaria siparia CBS 279.74]
MVFQLPNPWGSVWLWLRNFHHGTVDEVYVVELRARYQCHQLTIRWLIVGSLPYKFHHKTRHQSCSEFQEMVTYSILGALVKHLLQQRPHSTDDQRSRRGCDSPERMRGRVDMTGGVIHTYHSVDGVITRYVKSCDVRNRSTERSPDPSRENCAALGLWAWRQRTTRFQTR